MNITHHTSPIEQSATDLIAIGIVEGGLAKAAVVKTLSAALDRALVAAAKDEDFTGEVGQKLVLHTLGRLRAKRVVLVGVGAADGFDARQAADFGARVTRIGNDVGAKSAVTMVVHPAMAQSTIQTCVARGLALGAYRFTEHKSEPGRKLTLDRVAIHLDDKPAAADKRNLSHASAICDGVSLARDLVNRSPLHLYPETFASEAARMGKKHGLSVKIYAPSALEKMKMHLLLGVGAGSSREPRLVHMSYRPAGAAKKKTGAKPTVLVGKGITFDSGGLSLKPPPAMIDMKTDMGGAAAVVGTMLAIAQLKPKVAVDGVLALAENMPSGTAIRPGDVITSAAGRTVEINNTDAEGRLVLADALHFAKGLEPSRIIDLATLTGACMVALGPHTVGAFSNDDELAGDLLASAERAGEHFWRLPLTPALKAQLKSDVADTKNTGERWGGAITAALFLSEFVGETPWAHLDIAGPATAEKQDGVIGKGGTGVPVATLVDLLVG